MSLQTSFTNKSEWAFSPNSIGGCDFWLDATDTNTIVASGTSVTSWTNKGSQSFSATPSLGTPTTGSTWNGLNYISCPIGSRLQFTSAFNSSSDQTWFVVARGLNQVTVTNVTCRFVANAANDYFGLRRSTTTVSGVFQIVIGRAGTVLVSTQPTSAGTGDLRVGDSFGNVVAYCGINNTDYPTPTNVATVSGSAPLSLPESLTAATYTTASSVYTIGDTGGSTGWDFFEIIRYSRALTPYERESLEGYAIWKYKLRSTSEKSFIPTTLPNCALWLDAGYTNDTGNFVANGWADKSGNNRHATKIGTTGTFGTVSADPYYPANRDLYYVETTSNAALACPLSLPSDQPITFFIVAGPKSLSGTVQCVFSLNSTPGTRGNMLAVYTYTSATTSKWIITGGTTGTNGNTSGIIPSTSRIDIISGYWSPGSSQLSCLGSIMPASSSAPTSLTASSTAIIGANTTAVANSTTLGDFFNGYYCEIIIYTGLLSENNRRLVEAYLSNKWVIPLQTNSSALHAFRNNPPTQRLFKPLDLIPSNLMFWIDATDRSTITLSGSNVTALVDKSPTPNTITIGGTPAWSQTSLNGKPAFDMTNGRFVVNTLNITTTTLLTCFFIGSLTSYPTTNYSCVCFNATSAGGARFRICDVQSTLFRNTWTNSTSQTTNLTPRSDLNTPFVWGGSVAPGSGTSRIMSYRNDGVGSGVNYTTANSSTLTGSSIAHLRVGGDVSLGDTVNTWPGFVGEVLVFNDNLSFSDCNVIAGYLANKWGISQTFSTTFPFYKSPPNTGIRFDPSMLSTTPRIWLDAQEPGGSRGYNPSIGSNITRWVDKSTIASGPNFVPAIGSITYQMDGDYPGMYFNGSSHMNSNFQTSILNSTTLTVAVVGRTTDSAAVGQRLISNFRVLTAAYRTFWLDAQSSQGNSGIYYAYTAPRRITNNYTGSTNRGIHVFVQPGVATPQFYLNGTLQTFAQATGTITSTDWTADDQGLIFLGTTYNQQTGVTNGRLTGYIYEVIVILAALDSRERTALEGYLAWKWGIQNELPNSHPFKRVAP